MLFYLAPMEELTGYVYRNVYEKMFGQIDKYFTPFISPTQKKILKTREQKDVAPENNIDMNVVPQILTNNIENLLDTIHYLLDLGYQEVNLNLGCPAATVVSKGKGAGMLDDPDALDTFFEIVFDSIYKEGLDQILDFSVKTRIGISGTYEFEDILKVYNRYPISELIVHPRLREEYYQGQVHLEIFQEAIANSLHPVCYNGDINSVEDYQRITELFPSLDRIMIGRGILANPGLIREIKAYEKSDPKLQTRVFDESGKMFQKKENQDIENLILDKKEIAAFHECLFTEYVKALGEKDAMFKCKEVWSYLIKQCKRISNVNTSQIDRTSLIIVQNTSNDIMINNKLDSLYRKIQKSKTRSEYEIAVRNLFQEMP